MEHPDSPPDTGPGVVVCSRSQFREYVNLFELDSLDEEWLFEIDEQAAHLVKHPELGLDDVADVWE